MSVESLVFLIFQYLILFYFTLVNFSYTVFSYLGLRSIALYSSQSSRLSLNNLLQLEIYSPISILVPAYNEEKSIVASVRSFLSLHYPVFEVIVVSDGSKDETIVRLIEAFHLAEVGQIFQKRLPTQAVRGVYYSVRYPNLVLVDKDNGGKADALNMGLNMARYPLVCAVDADSVLDVEALVRAARLFSHYENVVAVGGTVQPLNGATVRSGQIVELAMPRKWIERFQILEYSRACFSGRAGWSALGSLLNVSGAFGLFKRDTLLEIGGYSTQTVTEDLELIIRLHKTCLQTNLPYRVKFVPDPICWTEAPSDWRSLRRQRNRWHRGLWETLWLHRDMLFNYRYGRIGLLAIPYMWFVEALSPLIELFGYVFVVVAYLLGFLSTEFVILFVFLAVVYGVLLSHIVVMVANLLIRRYERLSDQLLLLLLGVIEFLGYRQILLWERAAASVQVWRKRGQWGEVKRAGIS